MGKPSETIETLFEKFENYRKTTFELSKLKASEALIGFMSLILFRTIVIVLFSLFLFVLSVGVALWIGDTLGKSYYGFLIVAVFYLVAGLITLYWLQDWIKTRIEDSIIKKIYQQDEFKN